MKKALNFGTFEIDKNLLLDDEEKSLLSGLDGSKSIFTKALAKQYSKIAIEQKKRTRQLSMRLTDDDFLRAKTRSIE